MTKPDFKQQNKKPPKKITESFLHNSGLYYLQRFATSQKQFRTVMTRKIDKSCRHHTDQNREDCLKMLDELVEKFVRTGLLNDEVYARGSVASLRRRGTSASTIKSKLSIKGLDKNLVTQTLEEIDADDVEPEKAAAIKLMRRKKLGAFGADKIINASPEEQQKKKQKDIATLARAGFSFAIISQLMDADLSHMDEF